MTDFRRVYSKKYRGVFFSFFSRKMLVTFLINDNKVDKYLGARNQLNYQKGIDEKNKKSLRHTEVRPKSYISES